MTKNRGQTPNPIIEQENKSKQTKGKRKRTENKKNNSKKAHESIWYPTRRANIVNS